MLNSIPFFFPPPSSWITNAAAAVALLSLASIGISEINGNHLRYSKFWNFGAAKNDSGMKSFFLMSSRKGMLLLYSPALLAAVASFFILQDERPRFLILKTCLMLHYLKRDLEVLFVHKYSGAMTVDAVIPITLSYTSSTVMMLYAQWLTKGMVEPAVNLQSYGILLFTVGMIGNFYHHVLLSKLRNSSGEKAYKLPKGGLFNKIICPHYLFEILDFWGIAFVSQTIYSFSFALGTTIYLSGRGIATRRWYASKFDDFPKHIRILIPFIF